MNPGLETELPTLKAPAANVTDECAKITAQLSVDSTLVALSLFMKSLNRHSPETLRVGIESVGDPGGALRGREELARHDEESRPNLPSRERYECLEDIQAHPLTVFGKLVTTADLEHSLAAKVGDLKSG